MKKFQKTFFSAVILTAASALAAYSVQRSEANNGMLIMEDIPSIPEEIVNDLNRFQNVRSASFRDWTENGRGVYISTRFGDVNQIHRVDMPGGARQQVTFYKEPAAGWPQPDLHARHGRQRVYADFHAGSGGWQHKTSNRRRIA